MYQPKKQLRAILVACVKPECLQQVIERLIEEVFVYTNDDKMFSIKPEESLTGKYINIEVDANNFNERLTCHKWYPCDRFDGNPEHYGLLELVDEDYCIMSQLGNTVLYPTTTHFMYIKKP